MGIERQKSIVNPPIPTNTSLSILTTLFAIKKSVAKTLLRRADCLPSSLNSKAEERNMFLVSLGQWLYKNFSP